MMFTVLFCMLSLSVRGFFLGKWGKSMSQSLYFKLFPMPLLGTLHNKRNFQMVYAVHTHTLNGVVVNFLDRKYWLK